MRDILILKLDDFDCHKGILTAKKSPGYVQRDETFRVEIRFSFENDVEGVVVSFAIDHGQDPVRSVCIDEGKTFKFSFSIRISRRGEFQPDITFDDLDRKKIYPSSLVMAIIPL
jgi:hypothetical protein